jgi:hypothetical protein
MRLRRLFQPHNPSEIEPKVQVFDGKKSFSTGYSGGFMYIASPEVNVSSPFQIQNPYILAKAIHGSKESIPAGRGYVFAPREYPKEKIAQIMFPHERGDDIVTYCSTFEEDFSGYSENKFCLKAVVTALFNYAEGIPSDNERLGDFFEQHRIAIEGARQLLRDSMQQRPRD